MSRLSKDFNWVGVGALRLLAIAAVVMALITLYGLSTRIGQPFAGFRFEPTLTVSSVNEPEWNGPKKGLATYDRLLTANGQVLRTPEDLDRLVRAVPVGTPITYEVQRKGETRLVEVATQRLRPMDFALSFLPLAAIGLMYILIGSVAFWLKPGNQAAQANLLMALSFGLFCLWGGDFDTKRWFMAPYLAILFFVGSSLLHLTLVFPEPRKILGKRHWLAYLVYLPALLGSIGLVLSVQPLGHAVNPSGVDTYFAWLDVWGLWTVIGLLGFLVGNIYSALKAPSPQTRAQALTTLLGGALACVPATLAYMVPLLLGTISETAHLLVNLSILCFVFHPIAITYAIVRHKMFDIELIIKRTVVYSLVAAVLTGIYFVSLVLLRTGFEALSGASSNSLANAIATALVALLFAPMRDRAKKAVDRIFFRTGYTFEQVVADFAETVRDAEPEQALQAFVAQVEQALHPSYIALMRRVEGSQDMVMERAQGIDPGMHPIVAANHPVITEAFRSATHVPQDVSGLRAALAFPFIVLNEVHGCALIGPRKSDQAYSEHDRRLLTHLAQHIEKKLQQGELARLGQEMEIAARIQTSLLPVDLTAAEYEIQLDLCAATEVGGDLVDYLPQPDGRFWLAIGDVTGHGLTPGLVMMMAQSMLAGLVTDHPEATPRDVLCRLNKALHQNVKYRLRSDHYMTLQLIRHEGDGRFTAAGMHCDILILRQATGRVERLEVPGFWTGLLPDITEFTQDHPFTLEPGDALVLYTDGIIEAQNQAKEQFDMDRLEEVLRSSAALPASEIKAQILHEVRGWMHEQLDDLSLIVLKRQPVPAALPAGHAG